jgi:hypothetical protein
MACILADFPSWIQALVGIGALILAAWSLIVLRDYAADTKKIAKASLSQTENSQIPFLAVIMRETNPGGWGVENQGFGPAVNVQYSGHIKGDAPRKEHVEPLPVRRVIALHGDIADAFRFNQPFVIEYESLSGFKYRTTVAMVKNEMQTQFMRVEEVKQNGSR